MMKALRALPLEERRLAPGLNPARADIVIAGGAIIETVMDELAPQDRRRALAECGLREGLVMDHLARSGRDPRRGLGARAERAAPRARHRRRRRPRAARRAPRRRSSSTAPATPACTRSATRPRELLGYAALLHDIGSLLSYTDHQRHTFYLIRNADLLGFDQEEIAVMAATAFFHRKAAAARPARGAAVRRRRGPRRRQAAEPVPAPRRDPGPRARRRGAHAALSRTGASGDHPHASAPAATGASRSGASSAAGRRSRRRCTPASRVVAGRGRRGRRRL